MWRRKDDGSGAHRLKALLVLVEFMANASLMFLGVVGSLLSDGVPIKSRLL